MRNGIGPINLEFLRVGFELASQHSVSAPAGTGAASRPPAKGHVAPPPTPSRSPDERRGGRVFVGTSVPIAEFVEHLKAGGGLDDFLKRHPALGRLQACALLDELVLGLVAPHIG